jgi:tetratricopeptide (TPR) repeat protein
MSNGPGSARGAPGVGWRVRGLLVAVVLMSPAVAKAGDDKAKWCEARWKAESGATREKSGVLDYADLLGRWRGLAPKCSGTVAYEARLAMVHVLMGKTADAERVLKSVSEVPSAYAYLVELARLQMGYVQHMNGTSTEPPEALEARFRAYVEKHGEVPEAQAQYGAILGGTGKHAEAVRALEAAVRLGKPAGIELWGVWRNLTLDYEALRRHADACHAADEAVALRRELMQDTEFVCAAAKANAATGNVTGAVAALEALLGSRPEVRSDPQFGAAARFVNTIKAGLKPKDL